jgi:hypothetical protein
MRRPNIQIDFKTIFMAALLFFTLNDRRPINRSYRWFAPMEYRSARMNAGSFTVTSGLKVPSVAVNSG